MLRLHQCFTVVDEEGAPVGWLRHGMRRIIPRDVLEGMGAKHVVERVMHLSGMRQKQGVVNTGQYY
jgi:hypothetical protein